MKLDARTLDAAAAAIANARAGRRGAPQIANVLDILPPKLRDEVIEDAHAALIAAGFVDPTVTAATSHKGGLRAARGGA